MKTLGMFSLSLLALSSTAALAHSGPATASHFIEHMLLALAIGLPVIYGLKRLLNNHQRQEKR